METVVGSDFVVVEEKLHTCTCKLLADTQQAEEAFAAAAKTVKEQQAVTETGVNGPSADADAEASCSGKRQVAPVRTVQQIQGNAR